MGPGQAHRGWRDSPSALLPTVLATQPACRLIPTLSPGAGEPGPSGAGGAPGVTRERRSTRSLGMFHLEPSEAPFRISRGRFLQFLGSYRGPPTPSSQLGQSRGLPSPPCSARAHLPLHPVGGGGLLLPLPYGSPGTPVSPSWGPVHEVRGRGQPKGYRVGAAREPWEKLTPASPVPPVPMVRWEWSPGGRTPSVRPSLSNPLRNRHPADRDLEEGIHLPEAQRRAGRLVLFQEPLRGMELLSLPTLVLASNFSSWNLSVSILEMGIMHTLHQGRMQGFNGIRCKGLEWDPGPGRGCLLSWETGGGRSSLPLSPMPPPQLCTALSAFWVCSSGTLRSPEQEACALV